MIDSAAAQTHFIINDGTKANDVLISSRVNVEGQTSGEWILLGRYNLIKGSSVSVTITTKNANGFTAADAVLWVKK